MKMTRLILAALSAAVLSSVSYAEAISVKIDDTHAEIGFRVAHMVVSKTKGTFDDFEGSLSIEGDKLVGANVSIKATSINTRNEDRDNHLRQADFFDVEQYPDITFVTTSVSKKKLVGDLTMHGVTKPVTLKYKLLGPVKGPWGKTRYGFEASGELDRKDFGLTWNKAMEAGGVVVGETVELTINVEAF